MSENDELLKFIGVLIFFKEQKIMVQFVDYYEVKQVIYILYGF